MIKIILEAPLTAGETVQTLADALMAAVSPPCQVVFTSAQVPALGKCLCVFSHFDRLNRVDPHVFHHLRALQALGFDIVFVTPCRDLEESDRTQLLAICHKVVLRRNRGYDFGSYQAGILEMADVHDYEQVVLINDSIYGPLHDLKGIFEEFARREVDIWSITDSYEHEYHLQSYFLVFKRSAWKHPRIQQFWRKLWLVDLKKAAIHLYEIGLSRVAKKARLRLGAWCDYSQINEAVLRRAGELLTETQREVTPLNEIERRRLTQLLNVCLENNCNITHFYWDYLISEYQCPYLKVELLRDNPARMLTTAFYRDVLPASYPYELIREHLRRVSR